MTDSSSEEEEPFSYFADAQVQVTHVTATRSAADIAYDAEQDALIKQIDDARAAASEFLGTPWEQFRRANAPFPGKWYSACGTRFRSSRFLWAVEADFLNFTPSRFIDAWPEENIALNNEAWLGPYCRMRQYAFVRFHTKSAKRTDDYMYHHYRQGTTNKQRAEYRADIKRLSDNWPASGPWNRDKSDDDQAFVCDLSKFPPRSDQPGQWMHIDSTTRVPRPEEAHCFEEGAKPRHDPRFGGAPMHKQTGW